MSTLKKIPQKCTDDLVDQPESGMGYQNVEVEFDDGSTEDTVVINSDEALVSDGSVDKDIVDVTMR